MLYFDVFSGLSGSKLEAKAGIVGGAIDLGRIDTYVHLKEDNGTEPFHQCGLAWITLCA